MPRLMVSGEQYQIVTGPSKWDLMQALFEGNSDSQKPVIFTVEGIGNIEVQINDVGREDGSGESWLIKGYERLLGSTLRPVKGYFNTRSRKGHIRTTDRT